MSKQGSNKPTEDDTWTKKPPSKKKRGQLRLEYRMRPMKGRLRCSWSIAWEKWRLYRKKYKTEEQRKMAMDNMNRKGNCFEYRLPEIT